jgi:hypothetical protein
MKEIFTSSVIDAHLGYVLLTYYPVSKIPRFTRERRLFTRFYFFPTDIDFCFCLRNTLLVTRILK